MDTPPMRDSSLPMRDSSYLGPGGHPGIDPSILSRDSTYGSFAAPSIAGSGHGARSSWGSANALADAAGPGPMAGSNLGQPRIQSTLGQSAYTNPYDAEDVGHVAPAGHVPTVPDHEKTPAWASQHNQRKRKSRTALWILLGLLCLICIGVGLGVGLGLGLNKDKNKNENSDAGKDHGGQSTGQDSATDHQPSATATTTAAPALPTTGGKGSLITLSDGTTMTYENDFGGFWVQDPANPFSDDAQCNSWTPPLNQSWKWGQDKIHGVNVGGWLNTEPFIVPGLYERYLDGTAGRAKDEYTLSKNMGANLTAAMTEHYETFITERDFAEIASAGLNWVRLPIGHWAVEKNAEEPYLERVSWTYVLRAIGWARKYGLRINFDLHAVPGSQNGWNHSGRVGSVNWMKGPMGIANAQRSLEIIRTLAQFISQKEYGNVIPMFGFLNEPQAGAMGPYRDQPTVDHLGKTLVGTFYIQAYNVIRAVTGIGEGKGPMLSMHDAFIGIGAWQDFFRGADRMALDQHPYLVFQDQIKGALSDVKYQPCQAWAVGTNNTSKNFGVNTAGEFSAAINDCGQWLNGVDLGQRYDGTFNGYADKVIGSCAHWNDYRTWSDQEKADLKVWVMSSMDALQNYFFWTWKIGPSASSVPSPNPMWHYRLGLQEGWIPKDPREAVGYCVGKGGIDDNSFNGVFQPWQTGGAGAGNIQAAETAGYPWPPVSFTDIPAAQMTQLPQMTPTGTPITMPGPTYTNTVNNAVITGGNGWANPDDTKRGAYVSIANCNYPAEYDPAAVPANACGAGPIPTAFI